MKKHFFKIIVSGAAQFVLAFAAFVNAQETSVGTQKILFPVVPVILEYEFEPQYFSQVIDEHPQYSKIEAIIETGDGAGMQIALTEKEGGKRVFYSNSEAVLKSLLAERKEAYLTKIDFKTTQAVDRQPSYGFGFLDKNRQPILWRVIPASRPSERGRELIPAAWAEGLRLEYRNLATAVGAGTAIQIGEKIVEAKPWKEISSPPYFVAYRGAVAVGRHLGTLLPGTEKWRVAKQPEKLKKDAGWILMDERGNKRVFQVVSDLQNELVIDEVSVPNGKNSLFRLVIHLTPQGYNLRAVEIKNRSREMRIKFEPELPVQSTDSDKFEGKFIINQGEHKNIAGGTIFAERTGDKLLLRWQPDSPSWAKSRMLESIIYIEPGGYSIETEQIGK